MSGCELRIRDEIDEMWLLMWYDSLRCEPSWSTWQSSSYVEVAVVVVLSGIRPPSRRPCCPQACLTSWLCRPTSFRPACSFARTHRQTTAIFNLVGGRDRRTDAWRKHNGLAGDSVTRPSWRRVQSWAVNLTTSARARRYVCRRRCFAGRIHAAQKLQPPQYI